jgi:hypothetical protein
MRIGSAGALVTLLISASLSMAQPPWSWSPSASTVAPAGPPDAHEIGPDEGSTIDHPYPATGPTDTDQVWLIGEYLLWWFKKSPVPVPLVTTTSSPDQVPTAGFGVPGTSVLLGEQDLGTGARHGARFTGGLWLDPHHVVGFEGSYFFVASHTQTQGVSSNGQADAPILAVPFFADDLGSETSIMLASPSNLAGSSLLTLTSRLQGAELNGVVKTCSTGTFRFDVLAGFRFLELCENLGFATNSLGVQDPTMVGSNNGLIVNTLDQIDTQNLFYGCQIGVRAEYGIGDLIIGASAKLALGEMEEIVTIASATTTNFFNAPPGGPFTGVPVQTIPGTGIFGQPTNQGRVTRDEFVAVPEVGVTIGYQLSSSLRVFAGYDLLILSNVLRPGNQIDRTITFSQTVQNAIAGNPSAPGDRPVVPFIGSSFWAQGANFGLEWRY